MSTEAQQEPTKYARRCDITGKGMSAGWYDENGLENNYFSQKEDVLKHIKQCIEESVQQGIEEPRERSEDDLLEYGYNILGIFWTEWPELDEEGYYTESGEYIETI